MSWEEGLSFFTPHNDDHYINKWNLMLTNQRLVSELKIYSML